jgi:hypothetical protein
MAGAVSAWSERLRAPASQVKASARRLAYR